eukprot:SAG22_NODE_8629_length_640_cov_1.447320_1_plen_212_part_11
MSPSTVARVLDAIEVDGFAVVANLLPLAALDALVERSDYQAAQFAAAGKGPFLDNGLPRMAPWAPAELCVCPLIEQLAAAILGPGAFQRYWGGNCTLPAEADELALHAADETGGLRGLQGLHMDSNYPWSWPDAAAAAKDGQEWPHPPQRLFFNFGLHQMEPANGSTEMWPGTHRDLSIAGPKGKRTFSAELLAERRAVRPPVQVLVPRGAV